MHITSKLVSRTENGSVWNKLSIHWEHLTEEKVGTLLGDLKTLYLQWAPVLENKQAYGSC